MNECAVYNFWRAGAMVEFSRHCASVRPSPAVVRHSAHTSMSQDINSRPKHLFIFFCKTSVLQKGLWLRSFLFQRSTAFKSKRDGILEGAAAPLVLRTDFGGIALPDDAV
jgi:hypothetical protein